MHRESGEEQKQTVCECSAAHTDADRYNFVTVSKTNWRENTFTSSAMTQEQKSRALRQRYEGISKTPQGSNERTQLRSSLPSENCVTEQKWIEMLLDVCAMVCDRRVKIEIML
jgi:hypothetical protein